MGAGTFVDMTQSIRNYTHKETLTMQGENNSASNQKANLPVPSFQSPAQGPTDPKFELPLTNIINLTSDTKPSNFIRHSAQVRSNTAKLER